MVAQILPEQSIEAFDRLTPRRLSIGETQIDSPFWRLRSCAITLWPTAPCWWRPHRRRGLMAEDAAFLSDPAPWHPTAIQWQRRATICSVSA